MTSDLFEDRVRAQLHGATEAESHAFLDVDPSAVLLTGRRVVRRRRLTAVGGAAAAVLVGGLLAWSALGNGVDRASVPAGPAQTTATAAGGTVVLDAFGDLTGPDGTPLSTPGPRRIAVTVDPAGPSDLVYSEVGDTGGLTTMAGSSLEGVGPLAATWDTAGEGSHVVVGVLPAQARAFQLITPITDEGGHASTTVTAELPVAGRQAFAVRFAEASDAEAVRHLVWWGTDGVVRDEDGTVIPSADLGDADGTTVFLATALERLGTFSREGGASMVTLDASRNGSGRPLLAASRGGAEGMTGLFVVVVPGASAPGAFAPSATTTVTQPLTKALLDGSDRALLWAGYTTPVKATGSPWTSVTWTEPGGKVVTERP